MYWCLFNVSLTAKITHWSCSAEVCFKGRWSKRGGIKGTGLCQTSTAVWGVRLRPVENDLHHHLLFPNEFGGCFLASDVSSPLFISQFPSFSRLHILTSRHPSSSSLVQSRCNKGTNKEKQKQDVSRTCSVFMRSVLELDSKRGASSCAFLSKVTWCDYCTAHVKHTQFMRNICASNNPTFNKKVSNQNVLCACFTLHVAKVKLSQSFNPVWNFVRSGRLKEWEPHMQHF